MALTESCRISDNATDLDGPFPEQEAQLLDSQCERYIDGGNVDGGAGREEGSECGTDGRKGISRAALFSADEEEEHRVCVFPAVARCQHPPARSVLHSQIWRKTGRSEE